MSRLGITLVLLLGVTLASSLNLVSQEPANPLGGIVAALRANRYTEALSLSEQATKEAPRDPRLWTLKAMSLASLQRWNDALDAYRQALTVSPDYLPALKGSAEVAYNHHDADAPRILERLTQLQPKDELAQAMLGELFLRAGQCAQADTHLAQAGAAIDSQAGVLSGYSRCLVSLGKFDRAANVFDQLIALNPSDKQARYDAALAMTKLQRWPEAAVRLQPLLASDRPSEDSLTLAAIIEEQQGNTQAAVDSLRRAITLYPHNEGAYLDFVNLSYRHESVPVGLQIVSLGVEQNPQSADLHFARGVLLCGLGRTAEGLPDLEQANRLNPQLAAISVATGIAETQASHTDEAVAQFRRATAEHPQDALAWFLLAEALMQQQYPQNSSGYAELEHAGRRAIALKPNQVEAYDLMASFYLQADRLAEAKAMSLEALQRKPDDVQALYHLVLVTRKTGDKQQLNQLVQRLVKARAEEGTTSLTTRLPTLTIEPSTSSAVRAVEPK